MADHERLRGLQPDFFDAHARSALSQVSWRSGTGSHGRHPARCVHDRRLRNHGKEIPPANLEPVKHGLIVAQELMEYAYEHERQALINVLKHNTHENIAENPGLHEAHERFILGKHYDTVRRWGLEDDSLEKAMKSGVLPEPEERNDYLEQRGGER